MAKEVNATHMLARFVADYKTQREAAAVLGISQVYLSDMLNGRRDVAERVLSQLGLKRAVVKA